MSINEVLGFIEGQDEKTLRYISECVNTALLKYRSPEGTDKPEGYEEQVINAGNGNSLQNLSERYNQADKTQFEVTIKMGK